jgi:uncharacterized protein
MTKILLWIVVIFAVLFALRLLNAAKGKRRADRSAGDAPRTPPPETMVRCARCGVYLPRADAKPSPTGLICGDPGCAQRR